MTFAAGSRLGLVDRIAGATLYYPGYRYGLRGWGEWIALEGLLAAGDLTGNRRYVGFVEGLVAGWLDPERTLTPDERLAPAGVLLSIKEHSERPELLPIATRLADLLVHSDGDSPGAPVADPDGKLWVDSLYTEPTLLVRLGRAERNEQSRNRQALAYVDAMLGHLCAEGSLPYHGYDTASGERLGRAWGRGIGWALLGLVDLAAELPAGSTWQADAADRARRMADEMVRGQAASGHWHTVVDEPETYEEASIAAFMAAALHKGLRLGLLDRAFAQPAWRAWEATLASLAPDGTLAVSVATPPGDAAAYNQLPLGVFPWGQGSALRAAIEWAVLERTAQEDAA